MSKPVIIGAGLAGLSTALSLAPMPVIVLSSAKLGEQASSALAQGGVAAAVSADDAPHFHAEDTINAGGGLCDPDIVRLATEGGAGVIEKLIQRGVLFDRDVAGNLQLSLEAAHGRRRVVHAGGGDGAGRAIMQAMINSVRAMSSITVIENATVIDLPVDNYGIEGVVYIRNGKCELLPTNRVILATGGAGALWQHTTNPLGSWGCGLALAARAGAQLADLEFMQFHPTAIDIGRDPMPLASEALRGEGAVLIDEKGERFMAGFKRAELEPRDVVARAIWVHMNKSHRVFLDARSVTHFAKCFPAIYAICLSAGIDPAHDPIPIRPAAHYHMGGVAVDASGRSSVEGLWACGEVAATGLHGANRLASNSLLEAVFFGAKVAEDIKGSNFQTTISKDRKLQTKLSNWGHDINSKAIRDIMSSHLGVLRHEQGLETAIQELSGLAEQSDMGLVGLMIAVAAVRREESRGSHVRTDYPSTVPIWACRQILSLDDIRNYAQGLIREPPLAAVGA